MRRREFITLLGAAAAASAMPHVARAQQPMPVIGFLNAATSETYAHRLRGFHAGLKDTGYVEGENLAIVYRWANNQMDRLPEMAADLVRRKVALIVAGTGTLAALAAKAATSTTPIVFLASEDPVRAGLVASIARPGGHMTGVNFFNAELNANRLEILHQLVPTDTRIAVLVNPANANNTETVLRDLEPSARAIGLQTQVLNASNIREIDAAFATLERERAGALFVSGDPLFNKPASAIGAVRARHAIPASYASRDYPEYGGLVSYGANVTDAFRQMGVYVGRILKGAKPGELPVVQASKLELVINAQTARVLGLAIPPTLLSTADEVIE